MVRHVVLGNQRVLVNLDNTGCVRDLYYPHVGQENHVLGERQRIGVYTDYLSWIDGEEWSRKLDCPADTLTGTTTLENPQQEVSLTCTSVVDAEWDVFLRRITVRNTAKQHRRIALYFYHSFSLYGDGVGDTAGYDPVRKSVFFYKRNRYMLMSCATEDELAEGISSVSTYTVGQRKDIAWRDAEDGSLSRVPIAQGDVDGCFGKRLDVPAESEVVVWYMLCIGKSFKEVHALQDAVLRKGPAVLLARSEKEHRNFATQGVTDFADLSSAHSDLYRRSLLVIRSQIDQEGAILAGNDSDNMLFNRDTYSYLWPRDGALVAIALDRAGKYDLTARYFRFASELLYENGCFLHKYNPDGSLGSSWQPWIRNGKPHLPIQADETGLQLHALWLHHQRYQEHAELFEELYEPFILPAANFLQSWWDEQNDMPRESWTLWEDRVNVNIWTCAATFAGLLAAARFAQLKDDVREEVFRARADDVRRAVEQQLFSPSLGRFINAITVEDGRLVKDMTLESSMMGAFLFGMFPADDPRILATVADIERGLWVPSMVGGLSRNEKDWFHYAGDAFLTVKGNPWVNTTMWLAKHRAAVAQSPADLARARELLDWVLYRRLETGLLSEQYHPFTGEPISVCPLTWSHAEYVDAVHWYLDAYDRLRSVS